MEQAAVLIDSPRLTAADREAWQRREAMDAAYARAHRERLDGLAAVARAAISDFIAAPCFLGVSWGKDSLVLAHLLTQIDAAIPAVYFVHAPRDNPDCGLVRDAFVARHRLRDYREQIVDPRAPGDRTSKTARYARWVREGSLPGRRITGVRAAESKVRELSAWTHGEATALTCRPILRWSTADVFAYLHMHDLPVHPAYAQSFGGVLDREWLRVAPLGGKEGTGHGRAEWERRYYDV